MSENGWAEDLASYDQEGAGWPDDEALGELPEGWTVADPTVADSLLRRLGARKAEVAAIRAIADAEVKRLDAWEKDRTSGLARTIERLEGYLGEYARGEFARSGTATVHLPHGTIKTLAARGHVEIEDRDAFVAWAADERNARTDLLRTRTVVEPNKTALTVALRDDGEALPYARWVVPDERTVMVNTTGQEGAL